VNNPARAIFAIFSCRLFSSVHLREICFSATPPVRTHRSCCCIVAIVVLQTTAVCLKNTMKFGGVLSCLLLCWTGVSRVQGAVGRGSLVRACSVSMHAAVVRLNLMLKLASHTTLCSLASVWKVSSWTRFVSIGEICWTNRRSNRWDNRNCTAYTGRFLFRFIRCDL